MKPRVFRNVLTASGALAGGWLVTAIVKVDGRAFGLSMASAYIGLFLIAGTLLIGPLNIARGRPNPVSTHVRRDVGIWAGVVTLLHVAVGLQRHFRGDFARYFFLFDGGSLLPIGVRLDLFGLANWVGLAGTLVCIVLLALSNDRSLRRLGTRRWKSLQRGNYLLLPLVVCHGLAYQLQQSRGLPWVLVTVLITLVVLTLQSLGVRVRSLRNGLASESIKR